MGIDMGDAPAWLALAVSLGAVGVSLRANRHAKDSADASKDSAVSSRRSADASERQAAAAEAALPPPPPPVEWTVEPTGRPNSYVLRNTGTDPALAVEIDDAGQLVRPLGTHPLNATQLRPEESIGFFVLELDNLPPILDIRVRWEGSDGWAIVPLPHGAGG